MGLPSGWAARTTTRTFGALTLRLLARDDIVKLKLWSATDARTPERRTRDLGDLERLAPSRAELLDAVRWCRAKDGTDGFLEASGVLEILRGLGVAVDGAELDADDG